MSWGTDRTWRYLGSAHVRDDNRISIPEDVFELGVLPHPDGASDDDRRVYWGYDTADGTLILSDAPLVNDPPVVGEPSADGRSGGGDGQSNVGTGRSDAGRSDGSPPALDGGYRLAKYKTPHTYGITVGGEADHYRATIPSVFFAESEGGPSVVDERVPDYARVRRGEERHFLTAEEFLADGPIETNSSYLLTRPQLEGTIGGFDEANPDLPNQPRFV